MDILIIDDSPLMQERIKNLLSTLPDISIIGEVESLSYARNFIRTVTPDLIFLDIRLKDGVSLDFIKVLKKLDPQPIIIVLTNYPYAQYRERSEEAGADYFLEKRNDFNKIPSIVRDIMQMKIA